MLLSSDGHGILGTYSEFGGPAQIITGTIEAPEFISFESHLQYFPSLLSTLGVAHAGTHRDGRGAVSETKKLGELEPNGTSIPRAVNANGQVLGHASTQPNPDFPDPSPGAGTTAFFYGGSSMIDLRLKLAEKYRKQVSLGSSQGYGLLADNGNVLLSGSDLQGPSRGSLVPGTYLIQGNQVSRYIAPTGYNLGSVSLNSNGLIAAVGVEDGQEQARPMILLPVETVTINTFIPHNNVEDPRPFNGTLFKGDNRNAGTPPRATWNENGSHRTQQKFQVLADQALDANGLVDNAYGPNADGQGNSDRFVDIGETKSFDPDTSVDGAGNLTAAALADTTPGDPLMIAKATAPKSNVWIESTTYLSPKKLAVLCRCEAVNPLVSGAPAISYTITITIDKAAGTYSIVGSHDGFPAYEIYINGKRVHHHDPLATGEGLSSLGPPEEHDVNEVGKPLP